MTNAVWLHLYQVPRAVKFLETKLNGGCQELEGVGYEEVKV